MSNRRKTILIFNFQNSVITFVQFEQFIEYAQHTTCDMRKYKQIVIIKTPGCVGWCIETAKTKQKTFL